MTSGAWLIETVAAVIEAYAKGETTLPEVDAKVNRSCHLCDAGWRRIHALDRAPCGAYRRNVVCDFISGGMYFGLLPSQSAS